MADVYPTRPLNSLTTDLILFTYRPYSVFRTSKDVRPQRNQTNVWAWQRCMFLDEHIRRNMRISTSQCMLHLELTLLLAILWTVAADSKYPKFISNEWLQYHLSQLMRLWYLSHRRPVKAQASLGIRAVSPEPLLFAHMKYGNRRRVQPQIGHLAPLDGWACTFEEWVYGGWKVP